MFFKKKSKKSDMRCGHCSSKINYRYSFCPYCGNTLIDIEKEKKDFGMLGRNDIIDEKILDGSFEINNFGITDKIIGSLVNSLVKNLDKQFKELEKTEIENLPNGIKIRIGAPKRPQQRIQQIKKTITNEQLKKISSLPRVQAKSNIRRLSDKIVCELDAPGVISPEDVFVSKLESGYEIKAIGNKKIYVNSIPINFPLKKFLLEKGKLFVEFKIEE